MRTKIRRRPNGRWYPFAVDDAGNEESHGGYRTQREAKAAAAELRVDAARGRHVAPEKGSVSNYLLGEWLPARQNADISPGTRDTERVMVTSWILPYIGDVPLQKLSARDVDRLYATLRARGSRGDIHWPGNPSGASTGCCRSRWVMPYGEATSCPTRS